MEIKQVKKETTFMGIEDLQVWLGKGKVSSA